jgi:hypothetical protein
MVYTPLCFPTETFCWIDALRILSECKGSIKAFQRFKKDMKPARISARYSSFANNLKRSHGFGF